MIEMRLDTSSFSPCDIPITRRECSLGRKMTFLVMVMDVMAATGLLIFSILRHVLKVRLMTLAFYPLPTG